MKWSDDQKDWLRKNGPGCRAVDITKELNSKFGTERELTNVRSKLVVLGIDYIRESRGGWSSTQEARLIALCPTSPANELARVFGKIPESIRKKCERLGIQPRLEKHNRDAAEITGVQITKFYNPGNSRAMHDLETDSVRLGNRGYDTWLETNDKNEKALFRSKYRNRIQGEFV